LRTLEISESTSTMPADASLDVGVDEGPDAEAELADVDAASTASSAVSANSAASPTASSATPGGCGSNGG
jgi:hypothetical protein